jgi:SAM-dependent methyltransferase
MQKKSYRGYTVTGEASRKLCVGHFETHQRYPYTKFLLQHSSGPRNTERDFGCGPAKMMLQMLDHFEKVDGMDIDRRNLIYADQELPANSINPNRLNFYLGNGLGIQPMPPTKYDFIYSTICLQHIAVYNVRRQIFVDCLNLLNAGGTACIQVGYGWQGPAGWFENKYDALSTNGGFDASIPDSQTLQKVEQDLLQIGFYKIKIQIC